MYKSGWRSSLSGFFSVGPGAVRPVNRTLLAHSLEHQKRSTLEPLKGAALRMHHSHCSFSGFARYLQHNWIFYIFHTSLHIFLQTHLTIHSNARGPIFAIHRAFWRYPGDVRQWAKKECVPLWTDCSTQCRIEFNIRVPLDLYASLLDIPGLDALS